MKLKDMSGKSTQDIISAMQIDNTKISDKWRQLIAVVHSPDVPSPSLQRCLKEYREALEAARSTEDTFYRELIAMRYDEQASKALVEFRVAAAEAGRKTLDALRYMRSIGDHSYEPEAIISGTEIAKTFATESTIEVFIDSVNSGIFGEHNAYNESDGE